MGQQEEGTGVAAQVPPLSHPCEIWRQIAGYGGDYEVSNLGRVRSLKTGLPVAMSPVADSDGYLTLKLYSDGVSRRHKISRLVCEAFNGNAPTLKHEAAHLDGDKAHNHANNLQWATSKENNAHKVAHGTRQNGLRNGQAKFSDALICKVRALSRAGYSEAMIAENTGVSKSHVHRVLAGEARHG
jgi:hypothetical protein